MLNSGRYRTLCNKGKDIVRKHFMVGFFISGGFPIDFGHMFMYFLAFYTRMDSFGVEPGNSLNTPTN